jgi:[ribosomal protein S5]-alanine N-acetyltransferase
MTDRIIIRPPALADEASFLAAVRQSHKLHHPWVQPPRSAKAFRAYIDTRQDPRFAAFFVWTLQKPGLPRHSASASSRGAEPGLVGVINLNEIVRGSFYSAYLGYYAFEPFAGYGLMTRGLTQVITHAFHKMKLHRLEANIQPGNASSRALVKKLGFRREGFSPRYLKIAGRWRDHERWAILAEDW